MGASWGATEPLRAGRRAAGFRHRMKAIMGGTSPFGWPSHSRQASGDQDRTVEEEPRKRRNTRKKCSVLVRSLPPGRCLLLFPCVPSVPWFETFSGCDRKSWLTPASDSDAGSLRHESFSFGRGGSFRRWQMLGPQEQPRGAFLPVRVLCCARLGIRGKGTGGRGQESAEFPAPVP
jgi:hypothetical protein